MSKSYTGSTRLMGFRSRFAIAITVIAALISADGFAKPLKKSEANQIIPEGEYLVRSGRRVHGDRYAQYSKKKKSASNRYVAVRPVKKSSKKAPSAKRYSESKPARKNSRYPASQSAARSKAKRKPASRAPKVSKKSAKKSSRQATKRPSRKADRRHAKSGPRTRHPFPVAKETPSERDMPFVSVPHRTVSRHDRTIVMDDPAIRKPLPKPHRAPVAITPDQGVLDPGSEGPPAAVGEAKAALEPPSPVVGPAPASVVEAPVAAAAEAPAPEHVAAEAATREPDAFDLHSGADPMQHGP